MAMQPLTALRLRLTAWYVGTLGVILVLLGLGLFVVVRHQFGRQLDASLEQATLELRRAARIREQESESAKGAVVDAVDELHIPDRQLYLLDTAGVPVKPPLADPWIREQARRAAVEGQVDARRHERRGGTLRLHAERFTLPSGTPMVAATVADQVELEDQYAALIVAFGGAALAALVLVAAGGYFLSRKSTEPVERNIAHMRRFMADAAHELRTPVAVMRTTAEVTLQQERGPEGYRDALGVVEREAERLGGIVDDLMTLARADAGERAVRLQHVFLDDIVLDAADAARTLAVAKGVTLEVGTFEEAPLNADPTLIRQLVMNLVHNAIKFTPPGGHVHVDVEVRDAHPVFVVADTGVGIAPEHLPHVFERFFRGDPARVRAEGAGLGLSIARWVADLHHAEIAIASAPGRGTRVEVVFPRIQKPPVSSA
ncbi:MAG TPA: ATP-binding protein [Gemmatimonadaceae bacterium]|nr:ATP-binding protein [Gemmatimonadaceae bacterium]